MRTPDDIFAAMDALLPALHGLHQHRRAARQAFMHGYVRYSVVQDADASLGEMETWYRGMAAAVRAHPDWDGLIPRSQLTFTMLDLPSKAVESGKSDPNCDSE